MTVTWKSKPLSNHEQRYFELELRKESVLDNHLKRTTIQHTRMSPRPHLDVTYRKALQNYSQWKCCVLSCFWYTKSVRFPWQPLSQGIAILPRRPITLRQLGPQMLLIRERPRGFGPRIQFKEGNLQRWVLPHIAKYLKITFIGTNKAHFYYKEQYWVKITRNTSPLCTHGSGSSLGFIWFHPLCPENQAKHCETDVNCVVAIWQNLMSGWKKPV